MYIDFVESLVQQGISLDFDAISKLHKELSNDNFNELVTVFMEPELANWLHQDVSTAIHQSEALKGDSGEDTLIADEVL